MKIILANPRGFCAGVGRAIEIVKKVIDLKGPPVYIKHEVVHNQTVVAELRNLGAVFVEEIDEVPPGATVIYSAHGVSKEVQKNSLSKDLGYFFLKYLSFKNSLSNVSFNFPLKLKFPYSSKCFFFLIHIKSSINAFAGPASNAINLFLFE